MSNGFSDPNAAHIIGLWDFNNSGPTKDTGLADGIAQNGETEGGAFISGGALHTDGNCDYFDVKGGNDAPFNLTEGTVSVQFTQDKHVGSSPDTLVNRGEQADAGKEGWFEISVTKDGAVQVWHCDNGHDAHLTTGPGFFNPGDTIKATYAFSPADGLTLNVANLTQNTEATVTAANPGLTLDVTDDDDESWTFGARETDDGKYGKFFDGSIDYVVVYDRDVTNAGDGIVQGDDTDNLIDLAYAGDPHGDMIDAGDALLPGEAPDDDIVRAGGGDDTVLAGLGDDEVYGEAGDDELSGGAGSNFLSGGTGDDVFIGGAGADTFQGNAGQDNLDYSASNEAVQINLATGSLSGGDAANDSIQGGIDGAIGTDFDDTLIGFDQQGTNPSDTFTNEFFGGAGNDTIIGAGGGDLLSGGADADLFVGGTDGDVVDGGDAGDDDDTLDLSGLGPLRVVGETVDADGNSTSGTIEFLDGGGNVTGTMQFSEIENLILPDNMSPTAGEDAAATDEDNAVTIAVLANDTDPETDPLQVIGAGDGANGTTSINPDGTITYTPNPDFNGEDTFSYTVSDGNGGTDTATVTVTVNPVNDDPVANDDAIGTEFEAAIIVPVLDNDTDVDGDPIEVLGASDGTNGTTTVNPDGTITYTPNPGFEGDDTFNYTVSDGQGGTDTATVTVTVASQPLDGIVEGTAHNDLIDVAYMDDPEGDRIDNMDEILPGEGPNDDIVEAGGGDDTVLAGDGNDEVDGGTGDDSIDGEAGDDILDGGIGDDTLIGGDGNDTITDTEGDNVVDTSGGDDPRPDIGYPGLFAPDADPNDDRDSVTTGAGDDEITTGDDADTISSGAGDDTIDAGFDADEINAGDGDDEITGGEGSDTILAGDGDDIVFGGVGPTVPDAINIPDDGSGPFGPDLAPDNGRDFIDGGDGNDLIFGEDDDDTILGGDGDDTIDGGIDDDLIQGQDGEDELIGGQGDDTILGGDGNDTIDGGIGQDDLIGGADRDTFTGITAGDVVDGNESGDDFDTLDLTGAAENENPGGSLTVNFTSPDNEDGFVEFKDSDGNVTGTMQFSNIENVIPCFTPGTAIATPTGERRVEDLAVGDRIITRDNGLQEIRWIGQRDLTGQELVNAPQLQPVLIRAGSLGQGLPEHDMLVSPQHRILVNNERTALYFEEREVLAAAKHLTGMEGVDTVETSGTTYIHFMFDQHEVVLSNGAWTESFQPGEQVLDGMGADQRHEIYHLFPDLREIEGLHSYQAARRSLKKHEARLLMR